ncbi:MAG: ABC transporter permease subunit [Actinomycetota bacterium]
MGRLLSVEIKRIYFRRLVRVFVILAIAGASLAGIIVFFQSNGDEATVRMSLELREDDVRGCLNSFPRDADPPGESESVEEFCNEEAVPLSSYDPRFLLVEVDDVLLGTSVMLIILAWLIGASAVGGEWHTRNMTTLLTWEPRRGRVLVAKVTAAMLTTFLISMFLQAWLVTALVPAAAIRGSTEGVDAAWLVDIVELMARIGLIGSLGAAMGASLAMIGRNTAAAMGAGFAYLAIVEGLIRGLKPAWQTWLIGDNAAIVIGGEGDIIPGRSITGAALLIGLYALGLALGAAALFRSRDVP